MITKLHIENFKALRGKHEIPIAPITLIYGPNSGGKSSVIQALLLLKQSIDAGRFMARGSLVDLGSFQSCVWQHDTARPVRLGVTIQGAREIDSDDPDAGEWRLGNDTSVWLSFRSPRVDAAEATRVRLDAVRYNGHTNDATPYDVRLKYDSRRERPAQAGRYVFSGTRSRAWLRTTLEGLGLSHTASELPQFGVFAGTSLLPSDVRRTATDEEIRQSLVSDDSDFIGMLVPRPVAGADLLTDCKAKIESVLTGLRYLGPIRTRPGRTYSPLENSSGWVGTAGEYASQRLLRGLSHRYADGARARFTRWLQALDIPYKFHVRPVGDQVLGDGIRTTLIDERTRVSVGLTDVGSGVGQVLPLLVQAAFGEGQVLCVEQPELHLHPRAQAALGDVMAELADYDEQAKEQYPDDPDLWWLEPSATQWIVETHSETLLLRLKRRIREGQLVPQQIAVLYVEPGRTGSVVKELRLDQHGDFLDEWPRGFFEEAFNEVFS